MSGGKLWGLFQTKDVIFANSEKWGNFLVEFSPKFPFSLSKLLHFSRSEKNIVQKDLFFLKKLIFFRPFPPFYQNFQDLPPIFFIIVVKRFFSMSRRTLPRKLGFLLKKFYLTLFPESARTTICFSTIFFSVGTSKLRSLCSEHNSEENVFWKIFLKFSIRIWGRLFETPGERFAAGFSKLHFSCHEGTLKQKKIFCSKRFCKIFVKLS